MMAAEAATRSIDVPIDVSQIKKMAAVANRAERMSALVAIRIETRALGPETTPGKCRK